MFGCYRRSEAADPETYTAAVAMVLAHYPADIVKAVTDPYSGLPSRKTEGGWTGMPDVAEVKAACEAEAVRRVRLADLAALPAPSRKRLPAPPAGPGAFATVFVPPEAPQYEKMKRRTQTADAREWRYDDQRQGIWVAWSWFERNDQEMHKFVPFTDDELRARYGVPQPAQPLEQAAE